MKFRPCFYVLDSESIAVISKKAYDLLEDPGVTIYHQEVLETLASHGAKVDFVKRRAQINSQLIDKALSSVPSSFAIYDQSRQRRFDFGGINNYYGTSGSVIYVQDYDNDKVRRKPVTKDFVEHNIVLEACQYLSFQGGPFVCNDIPMEIADTYRLLLCMLFTTKATIATSFSLEGYEYMREMLVVMAGDRGSAIKKPAHIFTTNISSPFGWSEIAAQNLIHAAKDGIPLKFTAIPVSGGTAPVTLAGTMAQMTAENLSAVVIHQLFNPGSPILWAGAPSILEMRYGTTPMTSIESVLMSCANTQMGKHFKLPTGSHGGRANSKRVDTQSGIESAIAMNLVALVGTNQIGGAGFLEYASTQSLEKLLIDNEICGEIARLIRGLEVTEETMAIDLIKQTSQTMEGFMSSSHTRAWFKKEFHFPSDIIDVGTRSHYEARGSKDMRERAHDKVLKILSQYEPISMEEQKAKELIQIVKSHAKIHGMEKLPIEDLNLPFQQ